MIKWENIVRNSMVEFRMLFQPTSAKYHDISKYFDPPLTKTQRDVFYDMWLDFLRASSLLHNRIRTGMGEGYRVKCMDLDGALGQTQRTRWARFWQRRTVRLDNSLFDNPSKLDVYKKPEGATTLLHELTHLFGFTDDYAYSPHELPLRKFAEDAYFMEQFINPEYSTKTFVIPNFNQHYTRPSVRP